MKRKRFAIIVFLLFALAAAAATTLMAVEKGQLYMMNERQTLTTRAGMPCLEDEGNYCHMNFQCKPGHVATGIVMNLDDPNGTPSPTGFGVVCANPNELYKKYEVGPFGENFAGKVYRDPCDVGFNLSGATFYTNDRQTVSGVKSVCRRYWPVEQREGISTFGGGVDSQPLFCEPGKFVTGIKASYWRNTKDDANETGLYSLRFYCTEMREYLAVPKKERDPRDPKSRR